MIHVRSTSESGQKKSTRSAGERKRSVCEEWRPSHNGYNVRIERTMSLSGVEISAGVILSVYPIQAIENGSPWRKISARETIVTRTPS